VQTWFSVAPAVGEPSLEPRFVDRWRQ